MQIFFVQIEIRHREPPLSPLMFTPSSSSEHDDQSPAPRSATHSPSPSSPSPHIALPLVASTPHVNYVTISGDSSSKRPTIVENLNNLTQKSKEVGRKGTKRKALMYEGPTLSKAEDFRGEYLLFTCFGY